MLAKILSASLVGINSSLVQVEVDIASSGLPSFSIVGLADRAVAEAKERVRAAIRNCGGDFPAKRITVNLAPADIPKEGSVFDLAIALGILEGSGQLQPNLKDCLVLGELSLDGNLGRCQGVLSMVIMARQQGLKRVIVPKSNALEAAIVDGIEVFAFNNLTEVVQYLTNAVVVEKEPTCDFKPELNDYSEADFSQIKGQEQAKRALEIAAAGGHNTLLKGPPGAGKTLLARSFASILPPMSRSEALEVTQVYSSQGNLPLEMPLILNRPIRSPHHSASFVGIIGGGKNIRPGEVSLAHRGVLFLDELPEFNRQVLEALRQPIEDRQVSISRASGSITFPAQFILLAAQNPCPCGYYGTLSRNCVCGSDQIMRYQKKISGPLLDRIDIHLDIPAVDSAKLTSDMVSESSEQIRNRVIRARLLQLQRFTGTELITNSEMSNILIKKYCQLDLVASEFLKQAIDQMKLSARAYFRVLKVARTIADLADVDQITTEHIAEALQYRAKEA